MKGDEMEQGEESKVTPRITRIKLLWGIVGVALVALFVVGIWLGGSGTWRRWQSVASVDGKRITRGELDEHVTYLIKQGRFRLEPQADPARKKEVERAALDDLILRRLLQVEAERLQVKVGPGEEDVIFGQAHGGQPGESRLLAMAKKSGQDVEQVRQEVRRQLTMTRLAEKVTEGVTVSDEDVAKYYESHQELSAVPALTHLRLLVVESQERAEQLRQRILKGEDFGALARQNSLGGYKESGGEMGWVDPHVLPPPVTAAIEAIRDKGLTPVVETPNRFFVIRVEGRQGPRQRPLVEVKDWLTRTLLTERKRAKFAEWLEEHRRSAHIAIYL
jgi:foldase protein PrsA